MHSILSIYLTFYLMSIYLLPQLGTITVYVHVSAITTGVIWSNGPFNYLFRNPFTQHQSVSLSLACSLSHTTMNTNTLTRHSFRTQLLQFYQLHFIAFCLSKKKNPQKIYKMVFVHMYIIVNLPVMSLMSKLQFENKQ